MNPTARLTHLAFLVDMSRPLVHADDDLITGRYCDADGALLGEVILAQDGPVRRFVLLVPDEVVVTHVEAALANDHRVEDAVRRTALRYEPGEEAPAAVVREGERWDAGTELAFLFATTEDAEAALPVED